MSEKQNLPPYSEQQQPLNEPLYPQYPQQPPLNEPGYPQQQPPFNEQPYPQYPPPPPYSAYDPTAGMPLNQQFSQEAGQSVFKPMLDPTAPVLPQTIIQPVIHQVVNTVIPLGPDQVRMTCPHCQSDMTTRVSKSPSVIAYVSAAILCLVGCTAGCCLIPFCMDACTTFEHHCANCKRFIGKYSEY